MPEEVKAKEAAKYTEKDFIEDYEALCAKGFQIGAVPRFIPTNHGSFEFSINLMVVEKK